MRAVFGFASRTRRSAPSARRNPASSSTAAATAAGSIVTLRRTTGLLCIVLSPKLGSAIACRLPRPPQTIGTIWSGRSTRCTRPVAVDAAAIAQQLRVRLGPQVDRLPRVVAQERGEVVDVGERGAEPLGPHRVERDDDLAVLDVAEEHVRERVRHALGDQVEQIARVVVVDVGHRERALAAVHGDDVVVGGEAAALRERRPRRPLLPFADAEPEPGRLAEHRLRRLARALAADVAQAQRDRAPDRHRTAAGGAAHAARAVVDAELVAARAVHDQHREHARRRGREPERVPLRFRQRFERGEHEPERGGLDAGHRRVDRDELDRRDAVHRRQHADDVVGRDTATRRAAPRSRRRWRAAAERRRPSARRATARTARAGRPETSTRSLASVTRSRPAARAPSGSSRRAICSQLLGGPRFERVGEHEHVQVGVTDVAGDVVRVHRELLAHDRDDRLLVFLDRDRVLDRERRARSARAESDDRGVDLTRELVDLLAVARRRVADLRAGLDRDRLRAVAAQVLVPDARDQLPRPPRPIGAQADRETGERLDRGGTSVR